MSNRLKKDRIIFQMNLLDFYLMSPKEFKQSFPKEIDLNDSDYVVRFCAECDYFEIGHTSDKWALDGQIVEVKSEGISCGTRAEFEKAQQRKDCICVPIEF